MAKSVLIVEDSLTLRSMVGYALRNAGYEVYETDNVEAARDILNKHKVDLVILDILLESVTPGYKLLDDIKHWAKWRQIKVIVATARGKMAERTAEMKGADSFIPKPYDEEVILREVKKLIG